MTNLRSEQSDGRDNVLGSTAEILASWRTAVSPHLHQSKTAAGWAALAPAASPAKRLNVHVIFFSNRRGDVPIRVTSMAKMRGVYDCNGDTAGWKSTACGRSLLAGHLCRRGAGQRR